MRRRAKVSFPLKKKNFFFYGDFEKFLGLSVDHSKNFTIISLFFYKNLEKKFKPEGNSPSNADKSPVERLSLNRSQCGGYSTKYNTLTET